MAAPVFQSRTTSASTSAFSHTVPSGSDRLLVVKVSTRDQIAISGITFNGVSLTLLDTAESTGLGNNKRNVGIWYLINPDVTTADVVPTYTTTDTSVFSAENYTGVDQSTPLGTVAKLTQNPGGTSSSISVPSATDDLVTDVLSTSNEPTVGSGQTQRHNLISGPIYGAGSTEPGGSTSTTMSWTYADSGTIDSAHLGVAIKPVSGTTVTGSGTPTSGDSSASGTGKITKTGSGTPAADASTMSGTGEITKTGTGTITSDDSTMSGTGSVGEEITGSGTLSAQDSTMSGTGELTRVASGALASGNSSTSGVAERTITGSGTPVSDDSTMDGSGIVGEAVTGSGAMNSDDSTMSGTGVREITGSGTISIGASTASGTGEREVTGVVVDIFSGNSTTSGTATKGVNGSGSLVSGDSSMAGGEEIITFDTLAAFILAQPGLEGHIDDRFRDFLISKGFTDDLHNYDLFDDYLESLGFNNKSLWDKYYSATKDGFLWTQGL